MNTRIGDSEEEIKIPVEKGDRITIPSNAYSPTWLPNGYVLRSYSASNLESSAIYINSDNELITYYEYPNDQVLAVDTEDAELVENISINTFDGLLCIKKGKISISWIDNERKILARIKATNIDKDTVLKIAESVKGS